MEKFTISNCKYGIAIVKLHEYVLNDDFLCRKGAQDSLLPNFFLRITERTSGKGGAFLDNAPDQLGA